MTPVKERLNANSWFCTFLSLVEISPIIGGEGLVASSSLFSKYLLSTYIMPRTMQGTGDPMMNKTNRVLTQWSLELNTLKWLSGLPKVSMYNFSDLGLTKAGFCSQARGRPGDGISVSLIWKYQETEECRQPRKGISMARLISFVSPGCSCTET